MRMRAIGFTEVNAGKCQKPWWPKTRSSSRACSAPPPSSRTAEEIPDDTDLFNKLTVKNMSELKQKHLDALRDAINEAECWRGSFPDAQQRAEWDKFIATAREGLKIIRKERKEEGQ